MSSIGCPQTSAGAVILQQFALLPAPFVKHAGLAILLQRQAYGSKSEPVWPILHQRLAFSPPILHPEQCKLAAHVILLEAAALFV